MKPAPQSFNGGTLVASYYCAVTDFHVIMVKRPEAVCPYVTAVWRDTLGTEWAQGNYFRSELEARKDFFERVKAEFLKIGHTITAR